MKKHGEADKLYMPCPFCGGSAHVKPCQGKQPTYYWCCSCDARGFFPEAHFKRLDDLKKISAN